ncbi:CooT family nickel-binding protein [Aceticella autotrophica]|uniref:CooT family nickel-binding protein n=1 Tax=Aceticella autotrophica TaxID=2755338 RepID=A0A975GAG3_9THEO|nr:CooT family nickel-binding protein [Aceticella autotrophica]QSZ27250.1 CooT family nickel-binding protein [Aceticella autotrophica]
MCEANAYLITPDGEEKIMDYVIEVKPKGEEEILLTDLFGEEKLIKGTIKEIKLLDNKILINRSEKNE